MIKVLYLARLRDAVGFASESVAQPVPSTVEGLLSSLRARGEPFASELASGRAFKVAVNQQLAPLAQALKTGDEVAFLPPVTGG